MILSVRDPDKWYTSCTNTIFGGIRMMVSIYPAIGALVSGLFMLVYPLKEKFLTQIENDLATRRIGKENSAPAAS